MFWHMTQKTQATKAKVSKWGYIENNDSVTQRKQSPKQKGKPIECETIFANQISYKRAHIEIHKELITIATKSN